MLTDFIIDIQNMGFDFVADCIPATEKLDNFFTQVSDAINTVVTWFHNVNYFVPLDTIVTIIGIEVAIHVVMFLLYFTDKVRRVFTSFIP